MSSGCGDVLSLEDMKTAKKHQIFEAEVITGKAGGVTGGEDIDEASNAVTSQVQKTMPAILRDMGVEFEESQAQRESDFTEQMTQQADDWIEQFNQQNSDFQQFLLNSGYQFLGDYESGPYTITALNQIIRYQNELWRLNAATNPPYTTTGINSTSWTTDVTHLVSVGDANLRQELATSSGSAMIGMAQGGTVEDAICWITPEMFGAKGDGVTDDTEAVQAAINAGAGKELVFRAWRKYRCKNLTIPHGMTLRAAGRRLGGAIIPYGNEGDFEHTGNFILITAEDSSERGSTVTMFNITINARGIPLTKVDGSRLNGLVQTDNTTGQYRSGMQLYNCNISGFSGLNIIGGKDRSFGIIKDTQSESSDLTVCRIEGVDWRIDHCYMGRSGTGYGIELTKESNVVSHCDIYFNSRSGVAYIQSPGKGFFKMIACTINGNGEHGVTCTLPYDQPAGIIITENRFWNNSVSSDGQYHNIRLSRGHGHIITNNIHEAYQESAGSTTPRAGYCISLENGAQPAQLLDSRDNAWSYRNGFCNLKNQNDIGYQRHHIGSFVQLSKGLSYYSSIGMVLQVDDAAYPVMSLGNGGIRFGDGTAAPELGLGYNSAYQNCATAFKGLAVQGGYEDTYLRIGGWYIWQSGGTLRIKLSKPNATGDGGLLPKRLETVPSSSTSDGVTGDMAWDSNYAYFCVAYNTWRRVPLSTW